MASPTLKGHQVPRTTRSGPSISHAIGRVEDRGPALTEPHATEGIYPLKPRHLPDDRPTPPPPDPYTSSIKLSISEIANVLVEALGRSLVMRLAKVSDPHAVAGWVEGTRTPRDPQQLRLRTAYRVFQIINAAENEYAARAWFIGLNPQLDDEAPIDAIRNDDLKDVVIAATAFARTS